MLEVKPTIPIKTNANEFHQNQVKLSQEPQEQEVLDHQGRAEMEQINLDQTNQELEEEVFNVEHDQPLRKK